ncbi:hypothetical protein NQ318_004635 [Aromia moschata]|uniref:Uncharacterized protein n=1 Tax=Aromia moschata TaxID=1265417 RepID=A0AAV8Y5L2_9CUCU|nr:hypothetical protein NQ318_004635 [Aromia moschata]
MPQHQHKDIRVARLDMELKVKHTLHPVSSVQDGIAGPVVPVPADVCLMEHHRVVKMPLTLNFNGRKTNGSIDESSNTGTLKRQHSYKSRGSVESMGGRSGTSTPLCSTPVRERSSPFGERNSSPFAERPPSAGSPRSPASPSQ